jgi:predicted alpha/beta hydrolase family esterase
LDIILYKATFKPKFQSHLSKEDFETAKFNLLSGEEVEIIFDDKKDGLVFLYFHGNAGRIPFIVDFLKKNYSFASVSYPGYQGSSGKPSVKNIYETAEKMKDFVRENFPNRRIFVIGHSLGSQTAIRYAIKEEKTRVVAIVNGFDSVFSLCKDRLEGFWIFCLIAKSSFNAIKDGAVSKIYNFDLLVFHNPKDSIIPFKRGVALFKEMNVKNKEFIILTEGGHSNFDIKFITIEMLEADKI